MQRRKFLLGSAAAVGAAATSDAIEPIRRHDRPHLRLALAGYSFRQALNLNQKPPTMTYDGFIDLAATMPFDAVELTEYYFAQTTNPYLASLKGRCTRQGLDISGTAIRSDFCLADGTRLKQQIDHVKRWVEHTSRLGGKTIRIFAGTVAANDKEERARRQCIESIQEVSEYAGQFGVYLALENHGGITATADQMLAIVRAVKSNWFGVNLDTGNFHTKNPYADLERLAPYAVVVQIKTEIQREGQRKPEEADLKRKIQILRAANFRGYVVLEYEAAEAARTAVPRIARQLREMCG
ncbi:MAG TPA: sugar phosphate isomerase/epimerase family protein [Gemmataceae bacterium]|nr:sugar phosphate isomerase/epimerase family protein [Gemmataceae bacterium]